MINFVVAGAPERAARLRCLDPDKDWRAFNGGVECWSPQTYHRLKAGPIRVELSHEFRTDCINIAYNSELKSVGRQANIFVVGVRADNVALPWCNLEVVQNKSQVSPRAAFIPLWPQSGLIARNSARGNRLRRLSYHGLLYNHSTRVLHRASDYFKSGLFKVKGELERACEKLDIEFVEKGPEFWNDYSDIDAVVGLREFGEHAFASKPATKLVNAWLAGAPFIGGSDSAFSQIGAPEFDYFRVVSPKALEAALKRLRDDESLFASMIERGNRMAAMYDTDSVRTYWHHHLRYFVQAHFEDWRSHGPGP